MPDFEYRHIVTFEETSVVGNVYYTNHILWQGRCRELFLREHVPEILELIEQGLTLVTLSVRCEYFHELLAFDALTIRMRLTDLGPQRMSLAFEYWREQAQGEELVARGGQELACMMRREGPAGSSVEPEPWPTSLREALRPYLDHSA
jgi:enediyne biosynthesis thioesterase